MAKIDSVAELVKQIEDGLAMREEEFVRTIFDEHKDPAGQTIKSESLRSALLKLRIDVENQSAIQDFRTIHINCEKGLLDATGVYFLASLSLGKIRELYSRLQTCRRLCPVVSVLSTCKALWSHLPTWRL